MAEVDWQASLALWCKAESEFVLRQEVSCGGGDRYRPLYGDVSCLFSIGRDRIGPTPMLRLRLSPWYMALCCISSRLLSAVCKDTRTLVENYDRRCGSMQRLQHKLTAKETSANHAVASSAVPFLLPSLRWGIIFRNHVIFRSANVRCIIWDVSALLQNFNSTKNHFRSIVHEKKSDDCEIREALLVISDSPAKNKSARKDN